MRITILNEELRLDPLGMGYAHLADADVAALLNAAILERWQPVPVESVKAWALRQQTPDGEFLMKALKRAAVDDEHSATGLADTILEAVGVNMPPWQMDHPGVIDMMNAAHVAGFLTVDQVDELRAMGRVKVSRASELRLGWVRPGDVGRARNGE